MKQRSKPHTFSTCRWCHAHMRTRKLQQHWASDCPACPKPSSEERFCTDCQHPKPIVDFGVRAALKSGLSYHCRDCRAKYSIAWRVNGGNDIAVRSHRIRRYGVTQKSYDKMLAAQDGKCAICGDPPDKGGHPNQRQLAVDHDHVTGKTRGLLCSSCNFGLGKFKDNPKRLLSAIEYLAQHSGIRLVS